MDHIWGTPNSLSLGNAMNGLECDEVLTFDGEDPCMKTGGGALINYSMSPFLTEKLSPALDGSSRSGKRKAGYETPGNHLLGENRVSRDSPVGSPEPLEIIEAGLNELSEEGPPQTLNRRGPTSRR